MKKETQSLFQTLFFLTPVIIAIIAGLVFIVPSFLKCERPKSPADEGKPVSSAQTEKAQPKPEGTGFILETEPPGATVSLDGRELEQKTPLTVTDIHHPKKSEILASVYSHMLSETRLKSRISYKKEAFAKNDRVVIPSAYKKDLEKIWGETDRDLSLSIILFKKRKIWNEETAIPTMTEFRNISGKEFKSQIAYYYILLDSMENGESYGCSDTFSLALILKPGESMRTRSQLSKEFWTRLSSLEKEKKEVVEMKNIEPGKYILRFGYGVDSDEDNKIEKWIHSDELAIELTDERQPTRF